MEERQANAGRGAAARRHIIERPRLRRLLDESEASVLLLVAPAGYGKTTLARQWLADKPHVWHTATTASADVAALVTRLFHAARLTESTGSKLDRTLRLTPDPEKEVQVLIDFLANCFLERSAASWLAIDDYHLLMDSPAAESLVFALPSVTPIKLIVTSRRRPSWATARRIMYGEIHEIGRHDLAMDASEADEVLQRRSRSAAPGLVALADGWPAVIGMASLTDGVIAPEDTLDRSLYEFFAQEFFNAVEEETRELLCRAAVMPTITGEACTALLGEEGITGLHNAEQLGLLSREGSDWRMHPLLRRFLLMKFRQRAPDDMQAMASALFEFALADHDWDCAFSLIAEFGMVEAFDSLIRAGLNDLLSVGRLATLRRWVELATSKSKSSAVARIAEAEIAFRDGVHIRAEALAAEAIDELAEDDDLRAQGLFRAGQAAYFNEHYDAALEFFDRAVGASSDPSLKREARWAAFIAALDYEHPETLTFLDEFNRIREPNVNDAVRVANAELIIAMRRGGITEAVSAQAGATHLVGRASDPMIRTAFWNTYGWALALNTRYEGAKRAAARELEDAATYRLSFVEPHAELLDALASVGMREFTIAGTLLDKVFDFAHQREDLFLLVNASAVLARLHIAREDYPSAAAATSTYAMSSSSILYGEYLGIRALVLAALGESEDARATIASVRGATSQAEARALVELAELILASNTHRPAADGVRETIRLVKELGQLDAFVTAYRAFPELIDMAIRSGHTDFVVDILFRANDAALGSRYGLATQTSSRTSAILSRREEQVLDLVAEGRTNDEVARVLFISPVTVKAHLRHIYEKLGVRNRVEAAAKLSRERKPGPL